MDIVKSVISFKNELAPIQFDEFYRFAISKFYHVTLVCKQDVGQYWVWLSFQFFLSPFFVWDFSLPKGLPNIGQAYLFFPIVAINQMIAMQNPSNQSAMIKDFLRIFPMRINPLYAIFIRLVQS
jgi:hypothetical protein